MLIQPNILKSSFRSQPVKVFLCGPGYMSGSIALREKVKSILHNIPNVSVVYGEEIEKEYQFKKRKTDLQTLEVSFAKSVDFTLLLLESPGSMAEIGTFTQITSISQRLIVMVQEQFYKAESYISRGPLSLLARNHPSSIIYYNSNNTEIVKQNVLYNLTFYKYIRYHAGFKYRYLLSNSNDDEYIQLIKTHRNAYNQSITLASLISLESPTFPDLVLRSGLSPKEVNQALSGLFSNNHIKKIPNGIYQSINGYSDKLLSSFSTTALSQSRAKLIATS